MALLKSHPLKAHSGFRDKVAGGIRYHSKSLEQSELARNCRISVFTSSIWISCIIEIVLLSGFIFTHLAFIIARGNMIWKSLSVNCDSPKSFHEFERLFCVRKISDLRLFSLSNGF